MSVATGSLPCHHISKLLSYYQPKRPHKAEHAPKIHLQPEIPTSWVQNLSSNSHSVAELLNHSLHGRPLARRFASAVRSNCSEPRYLSPREDTVEVSINHIVQIADSCSTNLQLRDIPLPCDDLEDHDPKRKDVALVSESACGGILRGEVPHCSAGLQG
jgi:hypothetical protein